MPQEFVARNGLIALNNSSISGSLNVSGSITADQGFTGSLQGTASFATTASYALSASFLIGGGGGGLTVNVNAINNQTVNPSSGNGDRYVYSCTGVNTFILPNPAGNKNIYTFKLLNGSNTIYGSNFPLIDDGTIVYMSTPNTAINIISNNTIYTIF